MTNSSNIELSTERKLLATRIKKSSQFGQQETKTYYNYSCTKKTPSVNMDIKILVTSILFTSLLITDNLKNKF